MLSIYRDTLPLLLDDDAISLRRCQQKPPPFEVSFSLAQLVEFLFFYYGRQIKSKLRLISIFLGAGMKITGCTMKIWIYVKGDLN